MIQHGKKAQSIYSKSEKFLFFLKEKRRGNMLHVKYRMNKDEQLVKGQGYLNTIRL